MEDDIFPLERRYGLYALTQVWSQTSGFKHSFKVLLFANHTPWCFNFLALKNMETIYWTCGGVANKVNIIIVRLNSFFLGSHNSQEVTLPRKSQLPCAITFSSSHYPPLHLDWPHAPKKVDPSNYTGPMPPKSFKPGYRSKWQFYRNFEKTYIMTEVPQ